MTDTELDEGQKKFIQAAGISTAEFLRLKEVYEKERDAFLSEAPQEYGHPELDRKTLRMLAELKPAEALSEPSDDDNPMKQAKTPEHYLPKKQVTKEIIEIAKQQGDTLDDQSLKLLDDVLYSGVMPKGGAISDVKNAASVAKDLADLGKIFFDKYAKHLGAFGAVASLLKDILTMGEPEKKDPILKEIDILKGQLSALSDKIEVQFSDLKAFIVEKDFYENYTNNAKTLFDYMVRIVDCARNNKDAQGAQADFEENYKTIKPEFCVTKMLVMLKNDVTNLMKINMKSAELPTKELFMKWKEVIEGTLTQFLMLEDFASGLIHSGDKRRVNLILENITLFNTLVNQWESDYLSNRHYCDQALKFIRRIQNDVAYPKDEDKAEAIYNGLWYLFTRDNFYVVVLDKDIYFDYKVVNKDQLIQSVDCGQFNVFVYCVATHSAEKAARFRRKFHFEPEYHCLTPSIFTKHYTAMTEWLSKKVKSMAGELDGYGFFMAAGSGNVATRWPKQFGDSKKGPGYFTYYLKVRSDNLSWAKFNLYYLVSEP